MTGITGYVIYNENGGDFRKSLLNSTIHFQDSCIELADFAATCNKTDCKETSEYIINIHGVCYNIDELCSVFDKNGFSFADLFLWFYKHGKLNDLLNKTDGVFHFCIYDKTKKRVIIGNDRFGLLPLFIYTKDSQFAFAARPSELIKLGFVNHEFDKNAYPVFLKFGYLLGSMTWFKYIKKMPPATIIEFDITNKSMEQYHYWTFKEIKKSKISFDDAVDMAHKLFCESLKNQFNQYNVPPYIPLSAGYDSRLILACFRELFPNITPLIQTFGVKNCQDIVTANKVCRIAKIKNIENYLPHPNWFNIRKKLIFDCDCTFSIQDMHGLEFVPTSSSDLIINGYLGDTVFGGTYLPDDKKLYNMHINAKIARYYFGEYYKYSNFEDDYFDIDNPIVLQWMNRGINFINEAQYLCLPYSDVIRPFFSAKLIDFVASLPNEFLVHDKLYNSLVLKYYPKYFKYIGRNGKRPVHQKHDASYLYNKLKYKLNNVLRKCHLKPKIPQSYADYIKWIKDPHIKRNIIEILSDPECVYKKYIDQDIFKHLDTGQDIDISLLFNVISAEIYLQGRKE